MVCLLVPPDLAIEEVLGALGRSRRCAEEPARTVRQTWLDSFDWRLHRRGWTLLHETETHVPHTPGATLELLPHASTGSASPGQPHPGQPHPGQPHPGQPGQAVRIWLADPSLPMRPGDLPPGRLRQEITRALGGRCLLPVASTFTVRRSVRVLDAYHKTVAWVLVETSTVSGDLPLGTRVRLMGVLGYARAAREVSSLLQGDIGLRCAEDLCSAALAAAGRRARDYSSKLEVALRVSETFDSAMRALLTHLMSTVEANLAGVRSNHDPEFLHDVRVAVRRCRSLLGEATPYFGELAEPGGPIAQLRDELAWLGEVTGPTRDLDVWLMTLDEELAGGSAVPGELGALRQIIEERRRDAHRGLVDALDSPRFRELLGSWADASSAGASGTSGCVAMSQPAGLVASELVRRAYRRVLRRGRAIGADSPDEALHDLRKAAKRLRYLLEAFESLCSGPVLDKVVNELKALQDNLGELQDCAVQAESLAQLGRTLATSTAGPSQALMAIGYLVAGLETRRTQARADFAKRFASFERPAARQLVASLARGLATGRSTVRTKGAK
jgi:CHAD domain-containing protein